MRRNLQSGNVALVLAGRDILVPLTDATISYDLVDVRPSRIETILVNRAHATGSTSTMPPTAAAPSSPRSRRRSITAPT